MHRVTRNEATPRFSGATSINVGDTGFDSPHDSSEKVQSRNKGGANSGVPGDADAILADDGDGWELIVEAWPKLSADVRREMLDLVRGDLTAIVASDGRVVSR